MKRRTINRRATLAAIRNYARQVVCARAAHDHASAIIAQGQVNLYRIRAEKAGFGGEAIISELKGQKLGRTHHCKTQGNNSVH